MRSLIRAALTLALLAMLSLAALSGVTTVGEPDPWGGISPDEVHYLTDGSRITVSHDDVTTARVRVEGGRLWLDDADLGAYDRSQGIRFLRDGRLTVDGETRGSIGAR